MSKIGQVATDNKSKACDLLQKRHLNRFALTINLGFQDNIKIILLKCKGIVTYFKYNTVAQEKFKANQRREKPYSLLQEVPSRWNSVLRMIERILVTNTQIFNTLLAMPKAPLPLAAADIEVSKDLTRLLTPFPALLSQSH